MLLAVLPLLATAACVDRLPDQDRRITVSPPTHKTSVDLLWREYQANREDADRRYWGKAIEVSGKVTAVEAAAPARLVFTLETPNGVNAYLLDDQSTDIVTSTEAGQRVTLRCFCAGMVDKDVALRSCIRP